jgi:curli biogenesis system outer membrane secretion channel CsgG
VWDLEDLSPSVEQAGLGEILAGPVIEALQGRGYRVVERQRLLALLEELHLGSTALVDESTRLRLGRICGARWMVFGGFQTIGGQVRMDLRLVEVETGKVLKAAQRTVPSGSLPQELEAAGAAARDLVPGG